MPARRGGAGELRWAAPAPSRILAILHNPTYAGAYAFGRCAASVTLVKGAVLRRTRRLAPEAWSIVHRDHHPAYLSWEDFMDNQRILADNYNGRPRPERHGAVGRGAALLQGLVLCGRCGHRMHASYAGRSYRPRYCCASTPQQGLGPGSCWSVAAPGIDQLIVGAFLERRCSVRRTSPPAHASVHPEREPEWTKFALTGARFASILVPMTAASGDLANGVEVLIVTALKEEYDAVLQVDTGAEPASTWRVEAGPLKLDVAVRSFVTPGGRMLRIAVTRALEMGGVAAAGAAAPLVHLYKPRCLAMCGVCAGRRGDVNLGDVIIADRLWTYDTGATVIEKDEHGREVERFKADPFTYSLSAAWKHRAEGFQPEGAQTWVHERPRSYEDQAEWLLARLLAGDDPRTHPERKVRCANFDRVVPKQRERGWLEPSGLRLTESGRAHIEDRHLLHPDSLPEREAFAVRVGPIGTGTAVVRDPHIFAKLSERMRKVLGLEMEAAAIGAIAHLAGIEHMLVMKGVMDHADPDKSDNFKAFAARASAECLIAFLRQHLAPRPTVPQSHFGASATIAASEREALVPTGSSLRRLLSEVLPTATLFDAFCVDYFPDVAAQRSEGMSRAAKENLLLETKEPAEIVEALAKHQGSLVHG